MGGSRVGGREEIWKLFGWRGRCLVQTRALGPWALGPLPEANGSAGQIEADFDRWIRSWSVCSAVSGGYVPETRGFEELGGAG